MKTTREQRIAIVKDVMDTRLHYIGKAQSIAGLETIERWNKIEADFREANEWISKLMEKSPQEA